MATIIYDKTLGPEDALEITEHIIEVQNRSFMLGLALLLPLYIVEGIYSNYTQAQDRLLHVIIAFLKRDKPRPTWRLIVDALQTKTVNNSRLGNKLKEIYDVTSGGICNVEKSKPAPRSSPVANSPVNSELTKMETEVKGLHERFNNVMESTLHILERSKITVGRVVFLLSTILNIDGHRTFLTENKRKLYKCETHEKLFGELNMYWDYLAFDLLEQLINELARNYRAFCRVKIKMQGYSNDLAKFRRRTTLKLFCEMYPSKEDTPPPGFKKIVFKHQWPQTVTLEAVEKFRNCYTRKYNLKKCALMLKSVRPGSIIVTWFVPTEIIDILRNNPALEVFHEFNISRVEIDEQCIHQEPKPILPLTTDSSTLTEASSSEASGCTSQPDTIVKPTNQCKREVLKLSIINITPTLRRKEY